jgi:4-amino-4-deoxy-L-arabinose transferase-like glycosyltransferase
MNNNKHLAFWIFTIGLVLALVIPVLIQDAMFQDGLLYSCVAHNMGIGYGTFWFPQYSTLNIEGIPSFHEQLPLVFGIQSLFYRLLGDSIYVERFFVFLMLILHVVLINVLWKEIFRAKKQFAQMGWLPVFFWIMIPLIFWSFRQNMLENTVGVFTLASVILSFKGIKQEKNNYFLWIISSAFIFMASFSKGIPGFFPISVPFIYWLVTKKISFGKTVYLSLILSSVSVLLYGLFILLPDSRESLSIYFFDRLIRRVDSMPTVGFRFETLWRLFQELIPVMLFCVALWIVSKKAKIDSKIAENKQNALIFFLVGFSGTLPLMLTLVQKGWYMLPALPFFAIGFAILVGPIVANLIDRISVSNRYYKAFLVFSIVLFVFSFVLTGIQKGKINRDQDMVSDVYKIGEVVPRFSTLTVPDEMYNQYDFVLQGYLVRYFNISISPYESYDYFLKLKTLDVPVPDQYTEKVDLDLVEYELFRRK